MTGGPTREMTRVAGVAGGAGELASEGRTVAEQACAGNPGRVRRVREIAQVKWAGPT